MRTIGIRIQPSEATFAVYDVTLACILNVEQVKIPNALPIPEALKYIRHTVLDILREYQIDRAGLRVTESTAQKLSIRRLEIEGVIQEAFASSNLKSYYCGQISTIASRVGIERADFKLYIDGEKSFSSIDNWDALSKFGREAVFAALGAERA